MSVESGTLFLVVGPSGAGKDTLIDATRAQLNNKFIFPKREITRPSEAGGEDHQSVSVADFQSRAEAGQYAFHWGAHGLFYGIDLSILDELAQGRHVVVNVSRSILDEARQHVSPLTILSIKVPTPILKNRLLARGRESKAEIEARIRRASQYDVKGEDVIDFINDRPVDEAVRSFIQILKNATMAEGSALHDE